MTGWATAPVCSQATTLLACSTTYASSDSSESHAVCGVRSTSSRPASGWPGGGGSWSSTSRATPARWPESSARATAAESTSPPRPTLTSQEPGRIAARKSSSTSPCVDGVRGTWSETTSLDPSSSCRSSVATAPVSERPLRDQLRIAATCPPARAAYFSAVRPVPTMPTSRPESRRGTARGRAVQVDAEREDRSKNGSCRTAARVSAQAWTATSSVASGGRCATWIPARSQAATSTLSWPCEIRETTRSAGRRARRAASTVP